MLYTVRASWLSHPILASPTLNRTLRDGGGVLAGGQHDAAALEGLGAGTDTLEDLGTVDALLGDQVLGEGGQVAAEVVDVAGGDEAEDVHVAVHAVEEVPRGAEDVDGGDGAAGGGDGAGAAEGAEPDHELVVGVAVGRLAGEEVEGDVGDEVTAGVPIYAIPSRQLLRLGQGMCEGKEEDCNLRPGPLGVDALHVGQGLALDVDDDVGVGLDAAGAADPGPVDAPGEGAVGGEAVVGGALLARVGRVHAPEVVVDGVVAGRLEVPLAAEGAALGGHGGREGGEEGDEGLHFRFVVGMCFRYVVIGTLIEVEMDVLRVA